MTYTPEQRAIIQQAQAIKNAPKREQRQRARERRKAHVASEGQRNPPDRLEAFKAWLRELPCIACIIEGPPPIGARSNMEAAHQKLAIASRGWKEGGGGLRTSDRRSVGLCRYHHQDAPNACDKAQRKFWDRLNIGDAVADLCQALYAAYEAGQPGEPIISQFARKDTL
jgi:hypothetical protein